MHYLLIGAFTAVALNFLGACNCVFCYFRDKRGSKSVWEPIVFSVLVVVASILTWEGWYSSLITAGLLVNTVSIALDDPQKTRFSMFIKSPLCLGYNAFVGSVGGIIYECAVLMSSVIGIVRARRDKNR